jgi:hypothetical protein
LKDSIPHGPDLEPYVAEVKKALDAGFDHVVLMGVGPDQGRFIQFFESELAPQLRALSGKSQGGRGAKSKTRSAAKKK